MSLDLSNLLKDPIDYNVKIIVGEGQNIKEFKLHSCILASRSNYFKNALSARWAKKENGIIIFEKPNISPLVFEVLIKYIYTGILPVDKSEVNLVDIAIAADEIELLEVFQQLETILLENQSNWQPKDIVKIFQHDNFINLYNVAIRLACKNPKIFFELEDFFNLDEAHLIQLLKLDNLELEEIKIWNYLIHWGIKNTNSILDNDFKKWTLANFVDLENTLHNCIPHIRFYHMSLDDYTEIRTYFKDILPDGLDEEILKYFSNSSSKLSFKVLPPRCFFNSKIINASDAALIASWIDKKQGKPYNFNDLPFRFELIYRASREGFEIDKFHTNCDNKGPTIVIVKVDKSGEIIGGYNPLEWRSVKIVENEESSLLTHNNEFYNNHQCKTSNSFIFSLTSRTNPVLSKITSKKEAIIWCKNKGPCFGLKDLCINSSRYPHEIVGKSKQSSYEKKIIDKKTFKIQDYEVFQIIDNRFHILQFTIMMLQFVWWIFTRPFIFIKWMFLGIFMGIFLIVKQIPTITYHTVKWIFIVATCIIIAIVCLVILTALFYGVYKLLFFLIPVIFNILKIPYISYLRDNDYITVAIYFLIIYGPIIVCITLGIFCDYPNDSISHDVCVAFTPGLCCFYLTIIMLASLIFYSF